MTLLITVFAAVAATALWYRNYPSDTMKISALCYMYWGASLMWLVDAIFEYSELGAEYFNPATSDMINDAFLGLSAVAFGMVIWVIILLISDPKGVIKAKLQAKTNS
ncbi:MAG: hypothetical protein IKE53_07570 [Clostridiales bacterium]|nr:hypothetical protein [Clostridiales bacterium]